tara:strand:+ start:410 stop:1630 length:1221 start_codon:yes stop_codon:yes gene_type:complete
MLSLGNNIVSSSAVLGFASTKSVIFDGTNDDINLGNVDLLGGDDFSISMWIKASAYDSGTIYLLAQREDSNNYILSYIGQQSTNTRIYFLYAVSGETGFAVNSGNVTSLNNGSLNGSWINIVMVRDGAGGSKRFEYYLNGSGVGDTASINNTDLSPINANFYINNYNGTRTASYSVDETSIWNVALTDAQVAAIYNSGKPIDLSSNLGDYTASSNLQNWWRMGDGKHDNASVIHDANNPGFDANLAEGDNSDFDTVGNWSGAGATVAGGYDSGDTDHSTTLRIQADGTTNSRAELAQSNLRTTTVANKVYLVTFDFKWINTTDITSDPFVTIGGTLKANIDRTATGWTAYSAHFTAADNSTAIRVYVNGNHGHADNEILIDNFVIKPLKGFPGILTNSPSIQTDAP